MRSLFALLGLHLLLSSYVVIPNSRTTLSVIPTPAAGMTVAASRFESIPLSEWATMDAVRLEMVLGRTLGVRERLSQATFRWQLRREIRQGRLDPAVPLSPAAYQMASEGGFRFGGFLLSFIFGPVGTIIAYLVSKDSDFRRSALQGLGAWGILGLLLLLV
jgi:hypothetical protein